MFNLDVINWFLDKQDTGVLITMIGTKYIGNGSSMDHEQCKKKVIELLPNHMTHMKFATQQAYESLKQNLGIAEYVWHVICDLSIDYNTDIIKRMIGYIDFQPSNSIDTVDLLKNTIKELNDKNKQLSIDLLELRKSNKELIDVKDEQKKKLRDNATLLSEQEASIVSLEEKCNELQKKLDNLTAQNTYLRNRKSYTSEVINYENEEQLFAAFRNNASAMGLNYNDEDLINFYTSAKSSRMTIIEGISGTGKSKLVDLYGRTLGLDTDNRMLIIPVSPGWTDDTDILGFMDSSTMTYREASIGLVSFLVEAAKHPDRPYLISFDEMNLAKVEYYFAQFLSILENDVNNRVLRIYNPRDEKYVENSLCYPAEIRLGENLIFCGTINVDESTYRLSDKVLDRANLIKLYDSDFGVYDDDKPTFKVVDAVLVDRAKANNMTADELSLLDELNQRLKAINPRFCFAHRVIMQIERYLDSIPENSIAYTRERALDKLIVQKILTKIRGTEEQVKDLIGYIEDNNYVPGIIDQYLNDDPNRILYPAVRNALREKAKELRNYGYIG